MELDDLSKKIKLVGRIGIIVFLVFLLSVIDSFIAGSEPLDLFRAMPGTEQPVHGMVNGPLKTTDDIVFVTYSEGINVEFQEVEGRMWRGILKLSPYIDPGEYSFMVILKGEEPTMETPRYKVRVFPDRESYQRSFKSLLQRHAGIPPFWVTLITIPFIALTFGLTYYLSNKKDELLAMQGRAEIFKIKKKEETWEISFGLGQKHGLNEGDFVLLYDPDGTVVGKAKVIKVSRTCATATARISNLPEFKPDCFVRKN
jgi:hypothetical protein